MDTIKQTRAKEDQIQLVEEAFELIRDNLDDFEKRGKYIFKVIECRNKVQAYCAPATEEVKEFTASPNRQKPIDLYDLMDVELRMIRQKNLDMDFANSAAKEDVTGGGDKSVTIEEDEVVPN